MSARGRAKLHVVEQQQPLTASQRLTEIVPELIAAELLVVQLRMSLKAMGRQLAVERGVAFIREEHLRREFGE